VPGPVAHLPDAVTRHHRAHRSLAFRGDAGVARVERDAQLEDPTRVGGQAAVSEVHPKEIDIGRGKPAQVMRPAARVTPRPTGLISSRDTAGKPIANRRAGHPDPPGHLGCGEAVAGELQAARNEVDGSCHGERMFAYDPDGKCG
jgi:hypothetical protein